MKKFFESIIFLDDDAPEPDNIDKFFNIALMLTSIAAVLTSLLLLTWFILIR